MKSFPIKEGVPGFLFSGVACGLKKDNQKDLGLIVSTNPCSAAGVFTKNRVQAAPVVLCKKRLQKGRVQAVLVNSGNANAFIGKPGIDNAVVTCDELSSYLGVNKNLVAPCSTGVIGVPLATEKIIGAFPELVKKASSGGIPAFAEAIMTTDSFPKTTALKSTVNGETIKICGIAKGAGMIMPDMATMLCFIVTNAAIEKPLLKQLLLQHTDETFNRITVDGEMSTNDTVLLLTNGHAKNTITGKSSKAYKAFSAMLHDVMKKLALMIVKDGEGATKLITIRIVNAKTESDAKKAARKVANSLLVKTAFFGEDFNWGRIMGALGSSGAAMNPEKVTIYFNNIIGVKNGQGIGKNLARLQNTVKQDTINVRIDLHNGSKEYEIHTCDLSYEYVKINAEYTT